MFTSRRLSCLFLSATLLALVTVGLDSVADEFRDGRQAAAHRERRVIFDNDGNEPVYYCDEATSEALLDKRTTDLVGTQVDTIVYCTWSSGFGMFTHNTKVGQVFTSTAEGFSNNKTQAFIDQGTDPLEIMAAFCRENDIEIFWSMRMNDIHDAWNDWYSPYLFPELKKEHPEWLMSTREKPTVNGRWTAVDYTHPEIRDLAFQYFEEVATNYDVDGLMLDFMRHPIYFKRHAMGEPCGQEEWDMMTGLVARIRAMADETARKKGHPILVAVRVPDSTELARAIGLDYERWMREDLVDILVVSGYFRVNPWETSVELGHKYDVPVYPCLSETRLRDEEARTVRASLESYRARAAEVHNANADGVYMFNFFNPHSSLWNEVGSVETLKPLDMTYSTGARGLGDLPSNWFRGGEHYFNRLLINPERPRAIAAGESMTAELAVGLPPGETGADSAVLRLRFSELASTESAEAALNDVALEGTPNGNWLEFQAPLDVITRGSNWIKVTNNSGAEIIWQDLLLVVKHEAP